MSAMLDKLVDCERMADILKNDAAMTPTRCILATGNHRVAQNDEPEPVFPLPAPRDFSRSFKQIEDEANAAARAIVRRRAAMPSPTHRCLLCGTQYFSPGECDWCPVQRTPIQRGPLSEAQLAQADLENHHLKVSGELESRRDHSALQLQADMPKWGL